MPIEPQRGMVCGVAEKRGEYCTSCPIFPEGRGPNLSNAYIRAATRRGVRLYSSIESESHNPGFTIRCPEGTHRIEEANLRRF